MGKIKWMLAVITLALIIPSPSYAGWEKVGPEFQVNTYTNSEQDWCSVADLSDGGFVVTWDSFNGFTGVSSICGQRFDNAGNMVGSEFKVNTHGNSTYDPSAAGLSGGGFVVSWFDYGDGDSYGIFGQRFNSSGNKVGSEFQVNTYTDDGQTSPSVAGLSGGGFVITWNSSDGSSWGVYGQRFDSAGNKVGSEFQVNTYTQSSQMASWVAGLSSGGFVVTWSSYDNQDGSGGGIFGQRFDSAGNEVGSEFQVNAYTTGDQYHSSVANLSGGGFVVTWSSAGGQDGSGAGVFGQRFNSAGNKVGSEFQVNTYTNADQRWQSVAGLSGGGFVVTWESSAQDGSTWGVYGQTFDNASNKVGSEFQVNTYTNGDQDEPSVAGLSDGGFVVTWESYGQDGSGGGIYGQMFVAVAAEPTVSISASPSTIGAGQSSTLSWSSTNATSATINPGIGIVAVNGSRTVRPTQTTTYTITVTGGGDTAEDSVTVTVEKPEWTVMVYVDGDNNLEEYAIEDLNEMEFVGSYDELNIVVQIDRHPAYDSSNGNWTTCRRYYVTQDSDPNIINSTLIADIGEVNMGDPDTLRNFATWAITNYPADKYMLVLWDHGSGWKTIKAMSVDEPPPLKGVCYDDSSGGDALTNADLKSALSNILSSTGLSRIDCLGFDACLMQMIEVAYDVRTYASYMIGSEDVEWAHGWDYTFLNELYNDPSSSPAQLATYVVDYYTDRTMSVIDLSTVWSLKNKVDAFAQELIFNHCKYCEEITDARISSQEYTDDDYIDLYNFASLITQSSVPASLISAAQSVMNRVNNSVITNKANIPNSHGISIYYPMDPTQYNQNYSDMDFAAVTSWDDFVQSACCPVEDIYFPWKRKVKAFDKGTNKAGTSFPPDTELRFKIKASPEGDPSKLYRLRATNAKMILLYLPAGDANRIIRLKDPRGRNFNVKRNLAPGDTAFLKFDGQVPFDAPLGGKFRFRCKVKLFEMGSSQVLNKYIVKRTFLVEQHITGFTVAWQKTYGEGGNDRAYSVQETAGGGYIVAGETTSLGGGSLVLSLDANGEIPGCSIMGTSQATVFDTAVTGQDEYVSVNNSSATISDTNVVPGDISTETLVVCSASPSLWAVAITCEDRDRWDRWGPNFSIQQTLDGGHIMGCLIDVRNTETTSRHGIGVWKFNSDGTIAWQKTYGGGIYSDGSFCSIQQTSDGGYIVTGRGYRAFWVLKLNSNGTIAWQKTYDLYDNDNPKTIQQTLDGGYIVAGYRASNNTRGIWVLKLDFDGTVVWQKIYSCDYYNEAHSIQQTADGGYIVVGHKAPHNSQSDILVLKLNSNGMVDWGKTFGGSNYDYARSVQQTADGGYILAGYTKSFGAGGYDVWVLKLDSDGTIASQTTIGGSSDDYAFSIEETSDGGYILAGYTKSFGAGASDFWILKLEPLY